MEKRVLKASKSPGKKLRDQRRLNQFKAKRRLSFGFAANDNREPEEKGSGTEDTGSDLEFSECEIINELDQTKTETLAYDTDAMNNLKELLQPFTCLESTGSTSNIAISLPRTINPTPTNSELNMTRLTPGTCNGHIALEKQV